MKGRIAMTTITKDDLKKIYDDSVVLDGFGYSIPIDPFKIAKDLGIKITESITVATIKRSGSIRKNSDGVVEIWVNPFDADVRRRFTAAHELGHYINGDLKENNSIEDYPNTLYRTDGNSNPQEISANRFAAQLLMPKKHIYKEGNIIIQSSEKKSVPAEIFIDKMAKRFNVSKATMTYRLKGFGIIK